MKIAPPSFAFFLIWLCGLFPAAGATSALVSYAKLSSKGDRLLVMIPKHRDYDERTWPKLLLPDGRSLIIRDTFSRSGVYETATLKPVWQVDWYEYEHSLSWSPNMENVVRLNTHAVYGGPALEFYHEGRPGHVYALDDLLTGLKKQRFLPFTTFNWHYRWYEDFSADQDHYRLSTVRRELRLGRFELNLGHQESYVFDIRTGTMLSREVTGRWRVWFYCLLPFLLPAVPVAIMIRKKRRAHASA